jgi:fatty-acyl-CoA synthase
VGAHNPAGYWRDEQGTAEAIVDGWLHTGDVGRFDEDGFLTIVDRKKDMIISGGLNVYPVEIENVLQQHAAVQQCAVIGIDDPYWVEVPAAVVVRRPGAEAGEQELIDFVRERIAHFKAPKQVRFVEELPVSATGKVLKRVLRERYPGIPA